MKTIPVIRPQLLARDGNRELYHAFCNIVGDVISPLLANVALHGLETAVAKTHPGAKVIRYADDLVVLHLDLAVIQAAKKTVSAWLVNMGLELKPGKTRITHTLNHHEGRAGFDFLGFHIRQHRVGKTHSGKTSGRGKSKLLGFKTLIKPSKEAEHRHLEAIKQVIDAYQNAAQANLIHLLNPIIRGWTAYYSTVTAKGSFDKLAHLTFLKLVRWARRRHTNKSWRWIVEKYWHPQHGKWDFAPSKDVSLYRHPQTPIRRHIKVRGRKSPYDGDWVYWTKRRGRQPGIPTRMAKLLKHQAGKCARCGLYFKIEDKLEVDHIIPKSRGGKDGYDNWQLLHTHCHHQKSAQEAELRRLEALMSAAFHARSRMRGNSHVRF